ncbi:MAG: alpha/beta hydrolase [archaeon]|nr:alpha/beta hydrolase [archaeon]
MPFIEKDGLKYHYERVGSGIPVVLVTGLAGNTWFWYKTAPLLEGYDVIMVDNRGSGETVSEDPFTIHDMADDVAMLVDELGIGPVHIVGWSMGSHIALNFASRHPGMVRSLTLMSSYLRRPSRSAYILRAVGEGLRDGSVSDEIAGAVMNLLLRTEDFFRYSEENGKPVKTMAIDSKEGMYNQLLAVDGYNPREDAENIDVPVLSIHGLEDIMVEPRNHDDLVKVLKDCTVCRIPCEGHVMRPESYVPAIREFLEKH